MHKPKVMYRLQLQDLDAVCVVFKRFFFVTQFHLIASLAPTLQFGAAGGRILVAGWRVVGEASNWNNNECLHYHSHCCCYCWCPCFWLCLPLFGGVAAGLVLSAFATGAAAAWGDSMGLRPPEFRSKWIHICFCALLWRQLHGKEAPQPHFIITRFKYFP